MQTQSNSPDTFLDRCERIKTALQAVGSDGDLDEFLYTIRAAKLAMVDALDNTVDAKWFQGHFHTLDQIEGIFSTP